MYNVFNIMKYCCEGENNWFVGFLLIVPYGYSMRENLLLMKNFKKKIFRDVGLSSYLMCIVLSMKYNIAAKDKKIGSQDY